MDDQAHGAVRRPPPPVPTSISERAQAWLAAPALGPGPRPPSDIDDVEGWLSFIDAMNTQVESVFGRFPADPPVTRRDLDVDGVRTYVFQPHHVADSADAGIYLDIHGGGLILCGGELCAKMSAASAAGRDMFTWAVDYRMPPRYPYPTPLDDVMTVYRRVLRERDPRSVVVGGSSAGGNLAAALVLRAKDEGLPLPAALILGTPEVDLTESGDSFVTNLGIDTVLEPLMQTNLLYANGHDLAHPYLSPLFGDLSGFPPTYLQSGTRDLFLSNTVRFHRKLRAAGVEAELHVGEAMPHGGFGGATPEDRELAAELRRFLDRHLRR